MSADDGEVREGTNQEDRIENSYFDEVARELAEGTISRRQALKWLGAGALAFAALPVASRPAEALTRRFRRRCRRRGGIPLERGNCRCAFQCGAERELFRCGTGCLCLLTAEGRGFCGSREGGICDNPECDESSDCAGDRRCVTNACCGHGVCVRPC